MLSRPGSMMMGPLPGAFAMSRPASRTGSRPASGAPIFKLALILNDDMKELEEEGTLQE